MKMNLDRAKSMTITLSAIADIERAMEWYSDTSKVGPAYMYVTSPMGEHEKVHIQLDRKVFLEMMEAHKNHLISNLEERFEGFEYDPEAHWAGDNR